MTNEEFLREIEWITNRTSGSTSMEQELKSMVGWDSMAVISFIAMADEKLGIAIEAQLLASCKTVADLKELCKPETA